MLNLRAENRGWEEKVIKQDEVDKFLQLGRDFINDEEITKFLSEQKNTESARIRQIIQKSREVETLEPVEAAALLNVEDKDLWEEIFQAARAIKTKVYDNRVVTFAPLYCSSLCVNN